MKIIFWNKTASTENVKQGILEKETGNKNSKRPKYKHNGIDEKGICVRSKHKYELKLKIKGTKRSISQQFQIKQNYPKSRNNHAKQRTTMN